MKAWIKALWKGLFSVFPVKIICLGMFGLVVINFNSCRSLRDDSTATILKEENSLATLSAPKQEENETDPFFEGSSQRQFALPPTGGSHEDQISSLIASADDSHDGFCSLSDQQNNPCDPSPYDDQFASLAEEDLTPPAKKLFSGKPLEPAFCSQFLCPLTLLRAPRLMQRSIDKNIITITSAAIDQRRNRIYTIGRLTPSIAVLDGITEEWVNTIDSSFPFENIQKKLIIDPTVNYLYLLDLTNQQLKRLDLTQNEMTSPVVLPEGNGITATDIQRGRLYLFSQKPPTLTIFEGKNLNRLLTSHEIPATVSSAVYHQQTDTVYILDSPPTSEGKLIFWDAGTNKIQKVLRFDKDPNAANQALEIDSQAERFFISNNNAIDIVHRDGKIQRSLTLPKNIIFQAMAFDASHDILAVAGVTCTQDASYCRGGQVLFYNPSSGKLLADLHVGDAPSGLLFNPANYHFYAFGESENGLWSISADTLDEAYLLTLGDSIEQIILAQQGQKIYWNSRLGDNYLIGYQVDDGEYEIISCDRWPMPLRIAYSQQKEEHLLVLSSWNAKLNVFLTQPQTQFLRNIHLGLPANTSKCLADLSIDNQHGIAYAAFPQFAKIIAADWQNGSLKGAIELNDFSPTDRCEAATQIQILPNPEQRQLYVLLNQEKNHRLLVYDSFPPFSLIKEIVLEHLIWKQIERSSNMDLLFLDHEYNRLFIGPYMFDTKTLSFTKQKISRGQSIFAIDPLTDSYWALGIEENGDRSQYVVLALFRTTLSMRQSQMLITARSVRPTLALDTKRRLLYVSDPARAELQVFTVGSLR